MADIKIDEAKARIWISDVNNELALVKAELDKVSKAITTIPTDEDTIFTGIRKAGETLQSLWGNLCGTFSKVGGLVDDVISKTANAATELREYIDSLVRKFN